MSYAIRLRLIIVTALATVLVLVACMAAAGRASAAQAPSVSHPARQVAVSSRPHRASQTRQVVRRAQKRSHPRIVAVAAGVAVSPHGAKKPVALADGNLKPGKHPRKVARTF